MIKGNKTSLLLRRAESIQGEGAMIQHARALVFFYPPVSTLSIRILQCLVDIY